MLASLVFDRAGSVRHLDADGRLHIAVATVSKANVCRYLGHEIPGYQALGLDAAKAYRVFRDPDELAKAVDTFNGLPGSARSSRQRAKSFGVHCRLAWQRRRVRWGDPHEQPRHLVPARH
jgi:hypothetical protein